ncbi:MAG: HAMP domain-containing histidine kinase [Bacteroidia bacterium]|nr:HAMP domain-containing histidine kinase [Bacteroidia bacterium]
MQDVPISTKGSFWLVLATFLLFISAVLYLYDIDRSDAEIIAKIGNEVQEDLYSCINFYNENPDVIPSKEDICQAARLVYNDVGELEKWSREDYLPAQQYIDRLKDIQTYSLFIIQDRSYFQIRKVFKDSSIIYLIPLNVKYQVQNDYLIPYVFMGRHRLRTMTQNHVDFMREMVVTVGDNEYEAQIQLLDTDGRTVLSIDRVKANLYRGKLRYATTIFFFLALLFYGIYLRIYVIRFPNLRYRVNIALMLGIVLLRMLFYFLNWPGSDYLDSPLFSPDILAFHQLAPSLGEMTINIVTAMVVIFILYLQLRRKGNGFLRRIIADHYVAWPAMILTTAFSSFLLYWFSEVFQSITKNSLVEIEFSNIFATDIYSYLILLDVGMLLLACTLLILIALKLNVLYARRYHLPIRFVLFQLLVLFALNLYLNKSTLEVGLINSLVIIVMFAVLYRYPFKSFFKQDLPNYLVIILMFSLLVTFNIIRGVGKNNERKATRISQSVADSQATHAVFSFDKATTRMNIDMGNIQFQYRTLIDPADFRDWVVAKYIKPNFKEFDVSLYLYDEEDERITDYLDKDPRFGLMLQEEVLKLGGEKTSPNLELYRLPNTNNKYLDNYYGSFDLILEPDSGIVTHFLMELAPSSNEARGLYPSLSLDQGVYEDVKGTNQLDYAIYRDNVLFVKRGNMSFPTRLQDYTAGKSRIKAPEGTYYEYIQPIENGKTVVVRYQIQSMLTIITTFSFIFYFYVLSTLILIGLPYILLQRLRRKYVPPPVPLRAKIRYGLLIISVLPMIVIIALLYPFVSTHYYEDTEKQLIEEANSIGDVIEKAYIELATDELARVSRLRDFQEMVERLEKLLLNDINVYDENGRRIASTQPQISETGIYTDLMPTGALKKLSKGQNSELVVNENIGKLQFLSAYKPIVGSNGRPIGYINIPYLAKQDQLEKQVIEFLAYLANIYLLVFLLLNVMAVIVSNTITQPLAVVQQRLSETGLGERNDPIQYNSNDEIGEIVSAYNQMVAQLEASEEQIASNERELAWRQMARQVAHEIKNPLTPMRLSIQHLLRAWKEKRDKFEGMFPKVMNTLLVQIDSLVNIANSFSEFAKMPEPVKVLVPVNEVLSEVVDLYSQSEEAIWLIDIPKESFTSYADRDQLSRCFNNIIKNGLQAIEENGIMHVSMRILNQKARIEIKDNGKGIPEDVQKKIFEPSFSTKTSGMGLGLAIVKKIIENIGGKITFRSELYVGTTFIIEIPSSKLQEEAATLDNLISD